MADIISLKEYIDNECYTKTETWTQSEINLEIADAISKITLVEVVIELPTENIKTNRLYLRLGENFLEENIYDIYIYVNNKWERLDSIEFNITDYYTKVEIDEFLEAKSDISHTHTLATQEVSGFFSNIDKIKLDNIESGANKTIVDNQLSTTSNNPVSNSVVTSNINSKAPINHKSTEVNYGVSDKDNYGHSRAGDSLPLMDGTASKGTDNGLYARNDHVHPIDTSRASTATATNANNGLMSSTDKDKLDGIEAGANKIIIDNIVSDNSTNPVANSVVKVYIDSRIDDVASGDIDLVSYVKVNDPRLTDARTPTSHTHDTSESSDTSAYNNIGSSANSTQKNINDKINTALGTKANSNNVYAKNETYTRSEIVTLISDAVSDLDLFEVVTELPTSDIKDNRLYLLINGESIESNNYDIYLYVNNDWEQLDGLEFDIGNFYNKTEMDTLLADKVDTSDSRLTNARTPLSHTHGDITNTGAIGSDANKPIITTTNGKLTVGSFGSSANTFCAGDDSRLSDARTPTSHTHGNIQNDGTITQNTNYNTSNTPVVRNSSGTIINAGALYSSKIINESALSYIGSSANATQETINSNINTKLDDLNNKTLNYSNGVLTFQ